MSTLTFIWLLSVILTAHFIRNTIAFHVEAMTGGYRAEPHRFSYQVAIVRQKVPPVNPVELICGGGIISPNLVLSAAQCFINNKGLLKDYNYAIATDTINWRLVRGVESLIDLIYVPRGGKYHSVDIVVAKLVKVLNVTGNSHLRPLNIPSFKASFVGEVGVVAGYGYTWITSAILKGSDRRQKLHGGTDHWLRYANVTITNMTKCSMDRKNGIINTNLQFCGVMVTEHFGEFWDICEKDTGSPVVINNTVVGIAGTTKPDCSATFIGNQYTKVTLFSYFIKAIMANNPIESTVIYYIQQNFKKSSSAEAA